MATKSEIWEAKELIAYRIKEIELAQIGLAQSESDWQPKVVLLKCFSDMKDNLSTLKTHIIDNDDYTLAIELKDLIKPFLGRFNAELIKGEDDISRAINQQIFDFDSVFSDLQYWIREYETKHHETQQVEQTQHHETKETEKTNSEISQSELKELFIPVFFADDFKTQETATETIRLSRYDVFLQRLELLLNDTDRKLTNKDIGGVAILIYQSKFASMDYRQPSSKKFRGKFSALLKIVFKALGKPLPSETSPNKYQPSEHISDLFSDIFR